MRTLYARLAAGFAVLLLGIGLLYGFITAASTRHYLQRLEQELNRDLARNLVAERNLVEDGALNEAALRETFRLYMAINPSIEIYLLDRDGRILSYSADPSRIKRERVSLEPIRAFLEMEDPYPLLGDDPRSPDRKKAFSVTSVPTSAAAEGYLYVVLRGEQYDFAAKAARESVILRMSSWAVAISLLLGLLAGLVIFHLLTRRLRRLSTMMQGFTVSGFTSDAQYAAEHAGAGDEIDLLGVAFDRMAGRIREQIDQLQEQDKLRRRLVAQVSHDLRTPLASIQGYLESLQIKGDDLSDAERNAFIAIALRQGRHLGRLIDELFELASLDARESEPELEAFAPGEFAHDVLRKHAVKADERSVSLGMAAASNAPLARGDLRLTERALDNLIENALEHAPVGGHVDVAVGEDDGRLAIIVRDDGPGIDAADLDRIFEPFYRGGCGIEPERHAGLGLAIARRIMTLQGGDVAVRSATCGGATFVLWLPLAGPERREV